MRWSALSEDFARLAAGRHHDPHGVLGAHGAPGGNALAGGDAGGGAGTITVLAHLPGVRLVRLEGQHRMRRVRGTDVFAWQGAAAGLPPHHRLSWVDDRGGLREQIDPYSFAPTIGAEDLQAFAAGTHASAWEFLGAHALRIDDIDGVRFAVWAPNAERVSVVGPFCHWDGRRYPMRVLGSSGVWEIFLPGIAAGELYKYEIRNRAHGTVLLKSDPYAQACERRPATASRVYCSGHVWADGAWMQARAARDWLRSPLSIYELHAGSWRRHADGSFLGYRELADALVPYVRRLGYTHVQLLPLCEHPLDDSWGYQTTGYFAPTSRHGEPDELRYLIDHCHANGIGVLLDWVPGHFPRDAHGLAHFDGSTLYEYDDPRKAERPDWGTVGFDYERHEVRSFLISSACYWLEQFHFDGLRVDAVASMLYLDFGRRGEFVPNRHGGNHNLEAVEFLRALNSATHARNPGTLMMAEESSDWAMVSRPVEAGGLGFSMKWNMGWMHDTLAYLREDPIYRPHHHGRLTFGMMYAFSENFILPLSHDEVVHLKHSLLGRMPGDRWQQFANLRLLYLYQWTLPGKKLLFMGAEFGQPGEWDFKRALPWELTGDARRGGDALHIGVQRLVTDLNHLYVAEPALHRWEFEPRGFLWTECHDAPHSTLAYLRLDGLRHAAVALNFTPVPRQGYRVGVPRAGRYREVLNSDAGRYGGSEFPTPPLLVAQPVPHGGQPYSLEVALPPLAGVVWVPAEFLERGRRP
ncbi:MAG TPA: 1,4-alpha-glucan branching protein GlgB [Steroidobacteraceae bacterium]|jgi:1,4-alpha-glucan branching enzyme|nr:1,4-alpha-glucan branching protein GlgB [Steroidobacteraceae bacterium]